MTEQMQIGKLSDLIRRAGERGLPAPTTEKPGVSVTFDTEAFRAVVEVIEFYQEEHDAAWLRLKREADR